MRAGVHWWQVSLDAEDIRNEKVKVLRNMSPISMDDVVIGQYRGRGKKQGYLDDPTVPEGRYLLLLMQPTCSCVSGGTCLCVRPVGSCCWLVAAVHLGSCILACAWCLMRTGSCLQAHTREALCPDHVRGPLLLSVRGQKQESAWHCLAAQSCKSPPRLASCQTGGAGGVVCPCALAVLL